MGVGVVGDSSVKTAGRVALESGRPGPYSLLFCSPDGVPWSKVFSAPEKWGILLYQVVVWFEREFGGRVGREWWVLMGNTKALIPFPSDDVRFEQV